MNTFQKIEMFTPLLNYTLFQKSFARLNQYARFRVFPIINPFERFLAFEVSQFFSEKPTKCSANMFKMFAWIYVTL